MSSEDYFRIKGTTPYYNFVRKLAFPSRRIIVLLLFITNIIGCVISFLMATFSWNAALQGFFFGLIGLTIPSVAADLITRAVVLRDDRLFYLRRSLSLSLFSSFLWVGSIFLGAFISLAYAPFKFPDDPLFLGMFFVLPLRFLAIYPISSATTTRRFIAAILQPLLCLIAAIFILSLRFFASTLGFLISTLIGFLYVQWLTRYIEHEGKRRIGASPLQLFRGFLNVLIEKNNAIFEDQLEELSTEEELHITTIGFRREFDKKLKSVVVVSNFHPGPFMNVGSSALPHQIRTTLEQSHGAFTVVPHGISGHEMNLVSQKQNAAVLQEIQRLADFKSFKVTATPFTSIHHNYASASCQIFGACPLVTLTLSPRDMEDIPPQANSELLHYAEKDFTHIALVDAHNSIDQVTALSDGDLAHLTESAKQSIQKAKELAKSRFKLGVATIDLSEYSPRDGVGPGGGQVLLFQVRDQVAAYVIFDANNVYRGVREKIQTHLRTLGVNESEILTTDTHIVNGLVPARLGYHPLGEVIDVQKLLQKVEAGVKEAFQNLETCDTASNHTHMKVRILGLRLYKHLTDFVYRTSELVAFSMFPLLIVTLLIFLTYLSKIL